MKNFVFGLLIGALIAIAAIGHYAASSDATPVYEEDYEDGLRAALPRY